MPSPLLSLSLCLLLLLWPSPSRPSSRGSSPVPEGNFLAYMSKVESDRVPWRYHAAEGGAVAAQRDCQQLAPLTCQAILQARVAFYLGKGRHKTALRAVVENHTIVIRTTTSLTIESRDSEYQEKVRAFQEEWEVMSDASLCAPQRPILYGTCHETRYMADAVELVIPFTNVISLFQREKAKAREWWCWVVGWVMDVLEILMFAEKRGLYVHTGMFHKVGEYGVSATSLTLKQPDLGKYPKHTPSHPTWFELCTHKLQNLRNECTEVEELRKSDCGNTEIDICDPITIQAKSRLSQIALTRVFINTLFDLSPLASHPITPTLRSLFSPSNYFHTPSAEELHRRVRGLWAHHRGNECAADTFDELRHVLNLEETHAEREREMEREGKEYKEYVGKPFKQYLDSTLAENLNENEAKG